MTKGQKRPKYPRLNDERWIEIKYIMLCDEMHRYINNYRLLINYMKVLAEIAEVDETDALDLLRRTTQNMNFLPSRAEYICIAKQHGCTIEETMQKVCRSKKTYHELMHTLNFNQKFKYYSSEEDLELMTKIMDAHEKLRELGIHDHNK